jgi:hypothetical protein
MNATIILPVLQEVYTYTSYNLMRVYPGGLRVDSSNYDPTVAWAAGEAHTCLHAVPVHCESLHWAHTTLTWAAHAGWCTIALLVLVLVLVLDSPHSQLLCTAHTVHKCRCMVWLLCPVHA